MDRTVYVASTNPGKLRDFALAAARDGIQILPLPGLASIQAPAEDALTFECNAREKAVYYSRYSPGEMVLADDSGLEVDFLAGAPGVRSARYASDGGFHAANSADINNNLFLLQQLAMAPTSQRGARYRCALAVARDETCLLSAQGTVEGQILNAPRGSGGFGYDPLFYVPALARTMAEIDDQSRWTHSHRGQAFRALLQRFGQNLDGASLQHQ
jgi:XTP/dITP diphosphohydrolase